MMDKRRCTVTLNFASLWLGRQIDYKPQIDLQTADAEMVLKHELFSHLRPKLHYKKGEAFEYLSVLILIF
jgi:hypothetical protein